MTVAPPRPQSAELEAQALFEEAHRRRRRRRRFFVAGAAVVLAAVVVAALVTETTPSPHPAPAARHHPNPGTGGPSAAHQMPSQMVVWAQDGKTTSVQIIDSRSGHVERTLSRDDGLFRMSPNPSAAPDGTVYFDTGAAGPVEEIVSVPITGGTPKVVAVGHHPVVSPDGRYLAYLTWTDLTNAPEGVVVMDRGTGAVTTWHYSTNTPDISSISWAPDSESLMVAADTNHGSSPLLIGRLALSDPSSTPLDALRQVKSPSCPPPTQWAGPGANREMSWGGFLNSRDGIGICHHVALIPQDNRTEAVIFDLATGRVVRKLPAVPGLISGFVADSSGNHLAFIGNGISGGGLYRWSVDPARGRQPSPVLVKERVFSASWVVVQ